jgi:trigger factor
MPNVVRKDLDNTSAVLTVTVTRDELKPKFDAELKKFRQRAAIKGFRQGQAPMDFVKRMYGSAIFGDIVNDLISNDLYNYIRDENLNTLGQPLPVENQTMFSYKAAFDEQYSIDFEVGIVPAFEVKGIGTDQSFERLVIDNLDALAADDLEYARKRMGGRSNPEDDIQDNDMVKIKSNELENGVVKEGGLETTVTLLVKDVKDEALKAELLSKKLHDTLRYRPRSIEDSQDEAKYRKYILGLEADNHQEIGEEFEGVIVEVSRVSVAELNQEFFEGYFGPGVTTEEEALEQLKKGIAQFYETRADAILYREFQDHLVKNNPIELPERFLKRWLMVSNEGKLSQADIDAEFDAFAGNLRWTLIKDQIKDTSGIEVTEEDVRNEYRNKVRAYFQVELPDHLLESSVDRVMAEAKDLEDTKSNIEADKIYKQILSQVTIVEKPINSEAFHAILELLSKNAPAVPEIDMDSDVIEAEEVA